QAFWLEGSGTKYRPCGATAVERCRLMTPGCTTARRFGTSISRMRAIRANETTTPPSTGIAPPESPVPAPRGTIGTACSWQNRAELGAALPAESTRRRGDRERSDRRPGGRFASRRAHDRDGHAAHALVVFLVVERVALLADLVERAPQDGPIDDRSSGVAAQVEALEQRIAANGGQVSEEGLSGPSGVEGRAVPDGGEQTHDLGRRHRLDVDGLKVVQHDEVGGLARRLGQ